MPLKGIVSPSLLSGDFARLADECKRMISYGADYLHMDVMDGYIYIYIYESFFKLIM